MVTHFCLLQLTAQVKVQQVHLLVTVCRYWNEPLHIIKNLNNHFRFGAEATPYLQAFENVCVRFGGKAAAA